MTAKSNTLTARHKVVGITIGAIAGTPGGVGSNSISVSLVAVDENGNVPAGVPAQTQSYTTTDTAAPAFFTVGRVYDLSFTEVDQPAS